MNVDRMLRAIVALCLVLAPACRNAAVAPVEERVANADAPAASSPASASTTVQEAPKTETPRVNRDKHGNPDTKQYIDALQRPERVADLQIDVVIAKLALPPDADVGDLGCGPGLFAVAFAKACPQGVVYASDIEPAQLDAVRAKIHASKLDNIVPVLASEDDPHFPPGHLDVLFIGDTYHHLDDRVAYTRRLMKSLKPGGRLVILDYKPGKLAVGPPPEHKLAAGVMEKELEEAGWRRVERFDTHPYHDFEVWRVVQPWEKK
jgi:SAM-dependent methyltransferase